MIEKGGGLFFLASVTCLKTFFFLSLKFFFCFSLSFFVDRTKSWFDFFEKVVVNIWIFKGINILPKKALLF